MVCERESHKRRQADILDWLKRDPALDTQRARAVSGRGWPNPLYTSPANRGTQYRLNNLHSSSMSVCVCAYHRTHIQRQLNYATRQSSARSREWRDRSSVRNDSGQRCRWALLMRDGHLRRYCVEAGTVGRVTVTLEVPSYKLYERIVRLYYFTVKRIAVLNFN